MTHFNFSNPNHSDPLADLVAEVGARFPEVPYREILASPGPRLASDEYRHLMTYAGIDTKSIGVVLGNLPNEPDSITEWADQLDPSELTPARLCELALRDTMGFLGDQDYWWDKATDLVACRNEAIDRARAQFEAWLATVAQP